MKKLLTLFLALVMLFALAVPALAKDAEPQYGYYMHISDSVGRGCGLNATLYKDDVWCNYSSTWDEYDGGGNIPDSYPQIVASALSNGKKDKADANCQYRGMRSIEAYYALGGDVELWNFDEYFDLYFKWSIESVNKYREKFQEAAGTADLITLQIGANDIVYSSAVRSGAMDLNSMSVDTISKFIRYMQEGYNNFCEYYPKIIDRILELQRENGSDQDVTIMLVGYYNAFGDAPLTEELLIPAGMAYASFIDRINNVIRETAAKYEQAIYVDVYATQTPVTGGEMSVMGALEKQEIVEITHPNREGYAYIARQILNALPEKQETYPDTYIRLNLNKPFTVTKVKLGMLNLKNYKQSDDKCELIVPNCSPLHKLLTVTGKDGDGNTLVFTYSLTWNGNGYSMRLLSGVYDLGKRIDRVKNAPANLAKSIAGLLK